MKKQFLILLSATLFIGSTCVKENAHCHKFIKFINNSTEAIYITFDTHYPDTMYFSYYSGLVNNAFTQKVFGKSMSNRPLQNRDCWETDFTYGDIIPSDTLMIYIFDAQVLESVPWSTIVDDYKVLKRYDLSLEDLKKNNWTITYP